MGFKAPESKGFKGIEELGEKFKKSKSCIFLNEYDGLIPFTRSKYIVLVQ
ncbi:hypothetical protein [Rhodoblastus sp.]